MRLLRRRPRPAELSCKELVELVTDYLEGALPETDCERFEAHISQCGACIAYLDQIRQSIAVLGRLREETLPPGAAEVLLAEFRGWRAGS